MEIPQPDKIEFFLDQIRQQDHDLLVRTNQLLELHIQMCGEKKDNQEKKSEDIEKRVRVIERVGYIALGGLYIFQAWHVWMSKP